MTPLKRQLTNTTSLWGTAPREPITAAVIAAVGATGTTAALISIGLNLVYTALTSFVVAALTPKPEIPESQGLLVNIRDGVAPQDFVYGQVRKGGTVTYVETTGSKNKLLHQMIAIAGHEVEEIGDIYINDEIVSITDDTGYKPNGIDVALAGPGHVTTNKWTSKNRINSSSNPYRGQKIRWPRIRILKHDGSQTAVTDAFAGSSTATLSNTFLTETDNFDGTGQPASASFVGNDIAYIYTRLAFHEKVFANGIPLITAVVKGKKVYDPRTDTTAYSNNAALVIRDYLTSAYGFNDDEIDDTYFSAAADICDENVTLDAGGTEKRYTINGVVRASTSHQEVLTKMMSACGGTLFWGGGKWKLIVGDYTAPTKTLTLDDLRSPINLDTRVNLRNQFNKVQGTFNSAADDWITTDFPPITSSTFVTQDGGEETPLDLSLPFTTSASAAQRLAKQTLFRAREQMTFSAEFGLNALDVEVGEIISLDMDRYGWSGKEFEVIGWSFSPNSEAGDLRVSLTLRETSEAAFDWNAEETAIAANDTTLPDFTTLATVTNLTTQAVATIQTDGTTISSSEISWDDAGDPVEYYELHYKPLTTEVTAGSFVIGDEYQIKTVGTTDFTAIGADSNTVGLFFRATGVGSGTGVAYDAENNFSVVTTTAGDDLIASGRISTLISPLVSGTVYYIKVRTVDSFGNIAEDFTTTTFTATDDTTAPGVPTSLSAAGQFGYIDVEWTNPADADFSHALIYESNDSNFSNATNIGRSGSSNFIRGNLAPETTKYYWVSSVDYTGNESAKAGPVSATTTQVGIGDIQDAVIPYSALDTSVTDVFDDILGDIVTVEGDITTINATLADKVDIADYNITVDYQQQLEDATTQLATDALALALNASSLESRINDAGITVDPTTGSVTIQGLSAIENRVSTAEIDLDAVEASLTLKASITYVDSAIAAATLPEATLAELENTIARVDTAEIDIDALEGAITLTSTGSLYNVNDGTLGVEALEGRITVAEGEIDLKASQTDLDAAEARLTTAEVTLSTIDAASIALNVEEIHAISEDLGDLSNLSLQEVLGRYSDRKYLSQDIAYARQQLTADVNDQKVALAQATLELGAQIDANTALVLSEQTARADADSALASDITQLRADVDDNSAAIVTEQTARANADSALTTSITTLQAEVDDNAAAITTEQTARADADSALASDITQLQADLTIAESNINVNATAVSQLDARVQTAEGLITANSTDITALESSLTTLDGTVTGNATAISGLDTRVTSAEGSITTQASQITSLTTSVNSNTTSITQQATSIAGIEAQYSVEIDNNGNITGYQLISDATQRSAFNVRADQFNVFSTDGTISNSVFTVLTTPTTLPNGTVVPAGAYVDKIFVQDLSAQAATIGTFQSAASGARLVISDDKLEVYDANNVLRVKLGNLA